MAAQQQSPHEATPKQRENIIHIAAQEEHRNWERRNFWLNVVLGLVFIAMGALNIWLAWLVYQLALHPPLH